MDKLISLLVNDFQVNAAQLDKAIAYIKKHGGRLEKVLVNLGALSTDQLPSFYSKWLSLPYITELPSLDVAEYQQFPFDVATLATQNWVPFQLENSSWSFLVNDPLDAKCMDYLQHIGITYVLAVASEELVEQYKTKFHVLTRQFDKTSDGDNETDKLLELASEAPTVNLVNNLIYRAVKQGASDMHIETDLQKGRVRYRVDGVLHDADTIARAMTLPAVTRLKILSSMDIAERRRPQDGKIEMSINGNDMDIRVSVLPRNEGESVVMRFLRKDALKPQMQDLGMHSDIESLIKADLSKTSGVILLTGPTGSGKTTTLYTFLQHLNSPAVKIITLEDPIEYQLDGINQVQVHADIGFDFAAGLRSIVRQDPDIIMLGEIRDKETAAIAMQSALTGHLVFSTVHTNDAPSAYTRLLDLGVDEFLLNAALVAIIAQRLARKLCPHCKATDPEAEDLIRKHSLQQRAAALQLTDIKLMKAVGCEQCNHTGYKGRTAIMEYLRCDESIMAIPKNENFIISARSLMRKNGARSLIDDGLLKAMLGETTVAEVFRVAG
ncbi:GspE/PulE family protein [Rheinheimera gaetbuli]